MNFKEKLSIDANEVEQFSRIADEWWDETGKFKPLHVINPVRIEFVRNHIQQHFNAANENPLGELSLIDIGCGGGLMSEPMARLGAQVTGLDASEKNIKTATVHAESSGLDIRYICSSAEDEAASGNQYDVVMALEILEHVADVDVFLSACSAMVKDGGMLIVSTLNRTVKSYAMAIIGAEYIMRWLPKGTHTWDKFLKPSEVSSAITKHGLQMVDLQGMVFNPLKNEWKITPDDVAVNYLMVFKKS